MDINALVIFYKVAETCNFSKTSKILDIPISTISRKINKLEIDLNQKLFIRNTRKVILTSEGQVLYETSKPLFEELNNLTNIFEDDCNLNGEIRITSPLEHKKYLAPKIAQFRKQYPKINFYINFSNDVKDMVEDSYDFAFRAGNLEDSNLYCLKLYSENLFPYIYEDYIDNNLEYDALTGFNYCVMEHNTILTLKNGDVFKPVHKIVSNSIEFIQEYAQLQPTIVYIPETFANENFIKLNIFEPKNSSFHILYLHKKLNKPCRLFLDFFKQFQQ